MLEVDEKDSASYIDGYSDALNAINRELENMIEYCDTYGSFSINKVPLDKIAQRKSGLVAAQDLVTRTLQNRD